MLETTQATIDTDESGARAATSPPGDGRRRRRNRQALERAELALLDVEELLDDALVSARNARVAIDEHHRLACLPVGRLGDDELAWISEEYVGAVQALHVASRRVEDALASIGRSVRPEARKALEAAERAAARRSETAS